ncbi:MAG: hypothetical protein HGB36_12765 [Chlorobiaceae bacterium]|nr:hypothetical protein [Chlorobiaceae bacterium]
MRRRLTSRTTMCWRRMWWSSRALAGTISSRASKALTIELELVIPVIAIMPAVLVVTEPSYVNPTMFSDNYREIEFLY